MRLKIEKFDTNHCPTCSVRQRGTWVGVEHRGFGRLWAVTGPLSFLRAIWELPRSVAHVLRSRAP